jgi:hypothetical protein
MTMGDRRTGVASGPGTEYANVETILDEIFFGPPTATEDTPLVVSSVVVVILGR